MKLFHSCTVALLAGAALAACITPAPLARDDGGGDSAASTDSTPPPDAPRADAATGCSTAADCPTGAFCLFATAGCGVRGVCETRACPPSIGTFCGCDGRTFMSRGACAEQAFASTGPCAAMDAGGPDTSTRDGGTDATSTDVIRTDVIRTDVTSTDVTSTDAGTVCRTTADCPASQRCAYDPGSCATGATGHCIDRGCESLPVAPQYCGCDGVTTISLGSACPPEVPYATMGACAPADGGSGEGVMCSATSECAAGLMCCYPCGIPGCTNRCMRPDPMTGRCPLLP